MSFLDDAFNVIHGGYNAAQDAVAVAGDVVTLDVHGAVTNSQKLLSDTALLDGRILRVDLDPQVERLTESQLAEEISIIANMARQQARAAQHAVVLEFMHTLGHDRVATRGLLEHELDLPSPQTVLAEKAQVFASRYAGDDE